MLRNASSSPAIHLSRKRSASCRKATTDWVVVVAVVALDELDDEEEEQEDEEEEDEEDGDDEGGEDMPTNGTIQIGCRMKTFKIKLIERASNSNETNRINAHVQHNLQIDRITQ